MTSRELYEYALIECNKLEAPSLLLEDYNYFMNKAVQQYSNLIYNRYDTNQQSTDDLRVLKTSAILPLSQGPDVFIGSNLFSCNYVAVVPKDYMHLLNCIVEFEVNGNFKCYNTGDKIQFAARRLTSDMYAGIINNAYMRPMYKRPYYFINNVNTSTSVITNSEMDVSISNSKRINSITEVNDRTSNASDIYLEIRYGKDNSLFKATKVYIDYVKSPMFIRLTQSQIDETADTSQVLEWPDYVCYEIVNIFTKLILENSSDPRLQTNIPINQTIPSGGGQPQQSAQQQGQ